MRYNNKRCKQRFKLHHKLTMILYKYYKYLFVYCMLISLLIVLYCFYESEKYIKVKTIMKSQFDETRMKTNFADVSTSVAVNWNCTPKSNIVFFKTHKCASSTIQNIMMRYGYTHSKAFVLPVKHNYLGHPEKFNRYMVPNLWQFGGQYNIFTHHTRFDYTEIRSIMPADTIYLTIMRNPVNLFESMFSYYRLSRLWNFTFDDINNDNFTFPNIVFTKRFGNRIGWNQLMFDFGMNMEDFFNVDAVDHHIKLIDEVFDFVLIAENMTESLILMKEKLCWTMFDVIAFKLNSRKSNAKSLLNDVIRKKLQELIWADIRLYNHFKKKFILEVKKFGVERMKNEVRILNELISNLYDYCVYEYVINRSVVIRYYNKQEYNDTCLYLTINELDFTNLVRSQQLELYPNSILTRYPRKMKKSKDLFYP